MKTPKINFKERLQHSCENLTPLQRKKVGLFMVLILLTLCFIAVLQTCHRVSRRDQTLVPQEQHDLFDGGQSLDSMLIPFKKLDYGDAE